MTRRFSDEGGQALVLIAAAIAGLVLGIGLALDTGQLFVSRRAMQTASDAAAWAGATILYAGGTAAAAQTAATTDATRNGYTAGGDTTITAVSPPTTGVAANDPGYIEVTITRTVPTTFIRRSGAGTPVTVRSVAGIARSGAGLAVMVLDGAVASALNVGGGSSFTITGGPTQTNSANANAANVANCGVPTCLSASAHRIRGTPGGSAGTLGRISPAPVVGAAPALSADPFAAVAGPPNAGAVVGGNITTFVDLYPGVYTGLVSVNNGGTARLNGPLASPTSPGIYIFRTGLRTQGTGSIILPAVTGGVLIFNTYSNYPAAPGGSPVCGALTLGGTGQHTLAASKTGSYAGMLIYQDRNCTNNASITLRGAASSYSGTVYVPGPSGGSTTTLTITVNNNTTITSQIVVNRLIVGGGSALTMNFTPSAITGTRVPALIE